MKKILFIPLFSLIIASCGGSGVSYTAGEENGKPVIKGSNGIMWYAEDPNDPLSKLNQKNFADSVTFCQELDYAGHTDWRLPTVDELRTLVAGYDDIEDGGRCRVSEKCNRISCTTEGQKDPNDTPCSNPDAEIMQGPGPKGCYSIDEMGDTCGKYWSSTPISTGSSMHFQLDFADPSVAPVQTDVPTQFAFARCVRK